jgi:hypothetical protein
MVSALVRQRYTRACPSLPASARRGTRSGAPHEMAGEWPELGAVRSRTSCPCGLLGPAATESGTCPSSAHAGPSHNRSASAAAVLPDEGTHPMMSELAGDLHRHTRPGAATLEGAPTMPPIEAIAFAASAGFAVVRVATTLIAARVASGDAI